MILLLIIAGIILFALSAHVFPKYFKIFAVIAIMAVFSVYYMTAKNLFGPDMPFMPTKNISVYFVLSNYYNQLIEPLKTGTFDLTVKTKYPLLESEDIYASFPRYYEEDKRLYKFLDISYYKGKFYFYFGVTPVIIFYFPFNLVTGMYLTDKLLLTFLSCSILILLLLIINELSRQFSVPHYIKILSLVMIGLSNHALFLLIKPSTYEVAIAGAAFFLLAGIYLFVRYLLCEKILHRQMILLFLVGLVLSLAVGCRPHYALFIPLFFIIFLIDEHAKKSSIKDIVKKGFCFIAPCLVYGAFLAVYNYLRFDSIFEFGWKYQLNDMDAYHWAFRFKDLVTGFMYHVFQSPEINETLKFPLFSLSETAGNRLGNESGVGFIHLFPLAFAVVALPYAVWKMKKTREMSLIFSLLLSIFLINLLVASVAGVIQRYFFEYMIIIIIPAIVSYMALYTIVSKGKKMILNVVFTVVFVFTVYINISVLLSDAAAKDLFTNIDSRAKIIKILY
ncbi:MAG: hypothetical protein FWH43_01600 [Endomicrobia bacterium]|nr:hypothetical protein [Endomicrobiia bacterium]